MMKGTPGGIPVRFGGDLMYLCLAMGSAFPNELRAELRPAFLKSNVPENVVLPHSTTPLLDRVVPFDFLASVQGDAFRKMYKTERGRAKQRRRPGERKKP